AEHAAGAPDVLAHHHHVRVAFELDVEPVVDRFDKGELSHRGSFAARRGRAGTIPAGQRTRARTAAQGPPAARPPPRRSPRASARRAPLARLRPPRPRERPTASGTTRSARRTRAPSPP